MPITGNIVAASKEERKQQKYEMAEMEEKLQNLKANHSVVEAAYEVEKQKQKDEMVEMQETIRRQKDEMEEIQRNIKGIISDHKEERLLQQVEMEKLQTIVRGSSSNSGGHPPEGKEVSEAYSQVSPA